VIQSVHDSIHKLCKEILKEVKSNHFSQSDVFGIRLSIEEALINAVRHGNNDNPHKKVCVAYSIAADKFEISIEDEGCGFSPVAVPDPRCGENLYKATGRGLLLIRTYMDSVDYNAAGNIIHMVKYKASVKSEK
ncbi:MAG: ATP-binding protein, partial [Sedimentisphaerales bacterium]|nr:ATP-binding protein [Sedimentisphaerales bacterium]